VYDGEIIECFGDNTLHIVSCSNVIPVKRVHLIYEAFNLIENLKIEWTHFGDGDQFDLLKEKVRNLKSNIQTNLKGRIPNNEIYIAYRKLNPKIFINVSSSEGVPVSIMEALSFGIPVIASNVGGTSEIVNNQNGILLSANPTPHEIRAAIEEVIAHPEKREAAYQTWNELYNAEKNYVEFVKQLQLL
jgi:glycosyltransferase involved in cell wall biosynthesis